MTDRNIGRYAVIRILGEGAMGVVYEARDPNLDRRVAIKTIRQNDLTPGLAAAYERRFLTEARSVARLNHPHIVKVFDAGQSGADTFLVMEIVRGVNLKECLRRGVRFTPAGVARILVDVLDALSHAHAQKIIHRDIKPENILMDAAGTVKLTDFGIAKILDDEVDNGTQLTGKSIGTPRYMSPEQVRGLPIDERSDVFSAGVLLYELLTGVQPFDGTHHMAIASQILHDEPPRPSASAAAAPEALDGLVQKALAKRPEDRYQTAADFRADLFRAMAALPEALGKVSAASQYVHAESAQTLLGLLDQTVGTAVPQATSPEALADANAATKVLPPAMEAAYPSPADGTVVYPGIAAAALVQQPAPAGEQSLLDIEVPALAAVPAARSRWPLLLALLAVAALFAAVWLWLPSMRGTSAPAASASTAVTDPAQTLSAKEELVPVGGTPESPDQAANAAMPGQPLTAAEQAAAAATPTGTTTATAEPASKPAPKSTSKGSDAAKHKADAVATPAPAPDNLAVTKPVPEAPKPVPAPPVAARAPALPDPCPDMPFFERESCLWKACFTDAYRQQAVCKRFHPEQK